MDTGMLLHDVLRNQVLRHLPHLGPLLSILGDDCSLLKFVCQISILIVERETMVHE